MDENVEKESSPSPGSVIESTTGSSHQPFEPVRTGAGDPPRRTSSASSESRSITRIRSQNGYGVADEADELEGVGVPGTGVQAEKDPFEVGWEGGDSDPLCPRSFSKVRKWIIVFIVAFASFCV